LAGARTWAGREDQAAPAGSCLRRSSESINIPIHLCLYTSLSFLIADSASSGSAPLVTLAIFFFGLGIVGGRTAANALAATYYPTDIRSTGVGWALGIGRVGSIVGPLVGGMMLSRQVGAEVPFLAVAVPALFAAAAAFALSRLVERI
jgi:AAHS family 4-hydroxybenzoate transporter-like MFS transporter